MTRSLDTIQDEALVLAAQSGDAAALEGLLRRWLPVMRRHAARLTDDPAAVEDVCQESCLALVRAIGRLDDPAAAYGWMLRIVTHKAVDRIRAQRKDRDLIARARDREPRTPSAEPSVGDGPQDRAALIRAACLQLPADLRAVVSLHYGEGVSIAVMSEALGTPAGTIKSRLHDARTQLKSILQRSTR